MKKRMISLLLAMALCLSLLPVMAMAAADKIKVTEATYYDSRALESITVSFYWPGGMAPANCQLVLMTKKLSTEGYGSYGDYTDCGRYGTSYTSVANAQENNSDFGIIDWTNGSQHVVAGNTYSMSITFNDGDITTVGEETYFLYLWTTYGGHCYPDNMLCAIRVKDGKLEYKAAKDNKVDDESDSGYFEPGQGGSEIEPDTRTVTFDMNDGSGTVTTKTVENNKAVDKPEDPTRDGYTFAGWYKDAACSEAYAFTAPVTENITLYAKWTKDEQPAPELPWWAGLLPALDDELPFTDVRDGDWFYDDVRYVYGSGLMNGTSATKFSPNASTTRGMVLTILARMEGVNTSGTPWYAAGRDWAVANGISDGTNMEAAVTREQLAAILYRYASFKGRDAATLERELSAFADAGSVSGWAVEAMQWAVGTGLISGSNGLLRPQSNASRAEVAAILARLCEQL